MSHYLGYNAMQDFFPTMMMKPNDTCDDYYCRLRQKEHKESLILNPVKEIVKEEVAVVHEENDWGEHLMSVIAHLQFKNKFWIFRYFFGGRV